MAGAAKPDTRPLSPHTTIWRWHITMAGSILHRVTGTALYGAVILLVVWLAAVASGPETYANVAIVLDSIVGQVLLYLAAAAFAYHLANGVRHLVLDTGRGMKPADAETSAWFAILFAIAAPIGLWALVTFGA